MKSCIGCKFLSINFYCTVDRVDAEYMRTVDPLTGDVSYHDSRYPERRWLPTAHEQRSSTGRCGPDRLLFKPSMMSRIFGGYEK